MKTRQLNTFIRKANAAVLAGLVSGAAFASGNYIGGYKPDGTNTWVGSVTGGSMSDVNNWVATSPSGYTVAELFARHCFYDCTKLQGGAILTNDITTTCCYKSGSGNSSTEGNASKSTMVYGLKFTGSAGDVWQIVRKGGVGFWMCRNCRMEIEGGSLEWRDTAPAGNSNYPYKSVAKYGSGELMLVGYAPSWENNNTVYEGTLTYTNNQDGANMGHVLSGQMAKLRVAGGTSQIASVGGDKAYTGAQIQIDRGATLNACNGWNCTSPYAFYGDVVGEGVFRLTGGRRQDLLKNGQTTAHPFTGTYDPWIGEFRFGSSGAPRGTSPSSSAVIQGGGWMRFYDDQTLAAISGIGRDGGIDLPADKSLTVGGTAAGATNSYAGRITGKDFVKTGAKDTLNLGGSGEWTGETRVDAGRLGWGAEGIWRKGLVAYWSCEESPEVLKDRARNGAFTLARLNGATCLPTFVSDGAFGHAVHFGGDCKSLAVGAKYLVAKQSEMSGHTERPTGNHAFTFSFWMRPNKNTGRGPNFIHLDSYNTGGSTYQNVLGNTIYGISWGDGFFFGSVETDYEVSGGKTNAVRMTPFQKLAFYCGCGWTRNGKWVSGGSSKLFAQRTAVADFTENPNYLLDGNWHHVVGTYGGSNRRIRLYVDGVLKEELTRNYNMNLPSDPAIEVGNFSSGDTVHTYNGDLDELQYLNVEWTAEEVASEYAARRPKAESPLVAPVAHWTFDETREGTEANTLIVPDVSGNGIDLICRMTNTAYKLSDAFQIVETPYPAKTGNKCIYLPQKTSKIKYGSSMQVAEGALSGKLTKGGSFTVSLRHSRCLRSVFLSLGKQDSKRTNCIALQDDGAPARCGFLIGSTTKRYFSGAWLYGDSSIDAGFGSWVHETLVYDADRQYVYAYIDGKLCTASSIEFTLDPVTLVVNANGLSGTSASYLSGASYDDLRLYDCALSAEQVAAMVQVTRASAGGLDGDKAVYDAISPIPTNSPVTVASGATLAVNVGHAAALKSLSGAGTVELSEIATLTVDDASPFTGAITGNGTVLARAGKTLDLAKATVSAVAGFENDTVTVSAATAGEPLIKTTGGVRLPQAGTLVLSGATSTEDWRRRIFTIATCASYDGPADTTGWTFSPAADVKGKFIFSNGTLRLRMGGSGVMLLLR